MPPALLVNAHFCSIFTNLFSCKPFGLYRQQIIKLSHFIDLFLLVMSPKAVICITIAITEVVLTIAAEAVEQHIIKSIVCHISNLFVLFFKCWKHTVLKCE